MNKRTSDKVMPSDMDRRQFIKLGGGAVAAVTCGAVPGKASAPPARKPGPKNILFIMTDQQHIDTIRAGGCRYVVTPALDKLLNRGVGFTESYTSNPVCSPARSSMVTGRTSCEVDVHINGRSIRSDIPNIGQWFSQHTDYETVYAGKWHLPRTYTDNIPGFGVLHTGISGFGYLCDTLMSRACEGFLRNRSKDKPFLMIASFMQPHDICEWLRLNMNDPGGLRYRQIADQLPQLPDNFEYDTNEPQSRIRQRIGAEPFKGKWTTEHWRYYRWSYFRHIEQVDAEIGRLLRALDDTGYADDTLIVLTSDHGEGMGHHQMVRKSSLYDEASKVPLLFSWPGHIMPGTIDRTHLVSGLDIMPTLCDYAGIAPPPNMRGASLRAILEGSADDGRGFVVTESNANTGRMLRTKRYKYIKYVDDPVEQLFDMENDPHEMKNLAPLANHSAVIAEHRKLLTDWERRLDIPASVPHVQAWRT